MNLPLDLTNKTVLLAGCGGGYDVVCALPVALQLARQGCRIHLASFSFTDLTRVTGCRRRAPWVTVAGPDSGGPEYFPEARLSRWIAGNEPGISPEIFCYSAVGPQILKEIFDDLHREFRFDALLVVDGGVDGLFRGDEYDLGSPSIDAVSMVAGSLCSIPQTHYVMTAFGTEGVNKEVSHCQALERISDVSRLGGFLGVCGLSAQDPVTQAFDLCIEEMYRSTLRRHHSNMVGSIQAAYRGVFGDAAVTSKTEVHPVWISPLTSLYWFLDLGTTARLKLYFEEIAGAREFSAVTETLHRRLTAVPEGYRAVRPSIPI